MEKRNVELSLEKAKDWYQQGGELKEVALQAFTEDELKAVTRPHCWFDFCENYPVKKEERYIDNTSQISVPGQRVRNYSYDQNLCTSEQETQAFLALMRLRQLRKAWVGDWEPDWKAFNIIKYCIENYHDNNFEVHIHTVYSRPLSFPTEEMAKEFLHDFEDLIETAKELL